MTRQKLQIGQWIADPARNCLQRGDTVEHLEPKAMEVLLCLVEAGGEVVSASELIRDVWKDRPMGDNPVYKCIAQLRKAFDDDPQDPTYIETIPRMGYRLLIEPVTPKTDMAERQGNKLPARTVLAMVAVLLVAVAVWFLSGEETPEQPNSETIPSIAVLPFVDMSPGGNHDYLGHGMAEEILHLLARNRSLRVIARSSSFSFDEANPDIQSVADKLGVSHVLEGSIRRDGEQLRVTAQLIETAQSSHLWSETYDAPINNILDVQTSIARQILAAMVPRVVSEQPTTPRPVPAEQTGIYLEYLEGRYFLDQFNPDMALKAKNRFQQVLDLDPSYAPAWAGLADAYSTLGYMAVLEPRETASMIRASAERALELDPDQAGAHSALANVLTDYYFDWPEAERHFQLALEINPNHATTYQLYAEYLRDMGRFSEAMQMIKQAQLLAPLSMLNRLVEGVILDLGGRPEAAIDIYEQILELNQNFRIAHFFLSLALVHSGDLARASEHINLSDPDRTFPDALAMRGAILASQGDKAGALAILEELDALSGQRYISPFLRAMVMQALGDKDAALDLLEQAVEERSWFVRLYGTGHTLDSMRDEPRFQALLERVNLDGIDPSSGWENKGSE